jgi:BlaI family penicillinase repressor
LDIARMPRKTASAETLSDLTDLHLAILSALWKHAPASIAEIHAAIESGTNVALKTVATVLSRLEQRGLVSRRMNGREGLYTALVTRRQVLTSRVQSMLGALISADEAALGSAALRKGSAEAGDATRLRELLRRAEKDLK